MNHASKALASALVLAVPLAATAEAPTLVHSATALADASGTALRAPEGVACTEAGRVVVADTANGRLVLFTYRDRAFTPGAVIKFDELGRPARVQIDSRGNVLALDQKSRRIVRVAADGTFGGFLTPKNVPAGSAPSFTTSFKLDASDHVYLLDTGTRRVLVTDENGAFLRQIPLPAGSVVTDVAVDRAGTVFAVDAAQAIVYAAERGAASFAARTKGLRDFTNFPAYVAPAENGRLVLVDKHGNGLVVLGSDGKFLGRQLSIGWNDGLVYYPAQICLMDRRVTIVADRGNHRVQAFTASARDVEPPR